MSQDEDRERLRQTFGGAAEQYDRARPTYPLAVLSGLVELTGLGAGSRVLELGCGTGQLTVPLAALGADVTAVELSLELAAVARRNLAAYPNATVVTSAFEEWPLPAERFDLVVSATAFHWIDPSLRITKSADALRADGALAVIDTHHVAGGDEAFWLDVQRCYERWDPSTAPGFRLPTPADLPTARAEIEESPRFGPARLRRYEWDVTYTTEQYVDLLGTYSTHRALSEDGRQGLLDCIGELIAGSYGGRVTKRYLIELRVAPLDASA